MNTAKIMIACVALAVSGVADGKAVSTVWVPHKHGGECVYCQRLKAVKKMMRTAAAIREWRGMVALHQACAHGKAVRR